MTPGRRAQAQAQTRARLLAAADEMFAERGFDATTLQDIAARAGHTTGAVYSAFGSKASMFFAVVLERYRRALKTRDPASEPPTSFEDGVRTFVTRWMSRTSPGPAASASLADTMELTALALRQSEGVTDTYQGAHLLVAVLDRYLQLLARRDGLDIDTRSLAPLLFSFVAGALQLRLLATPPSDERAILSPEQVASACVEVARSAPPPPPIPPVRHAPAATSRSRRADGSTVGPVDLVDAVTTGPLVAPDGGTLLAILPLDAAHIAYDLVPAVLDSDRPPRLALDLVDPSPDGERLAAVASGLTDLLDALPGAARVLDLHIAIDPQGEGPRLLGAPRDRVTLCFIGSDGRLHGSLSLDDTDPKPAVHDLLAEVFAREPAVQE